MARTLLLYFLLAICTHLSFGQTIIDTVTIGTGTADDYFGGPIYRSSSSSSFDYSRYSYLYTASEMAAQGIPPGAVIKGIAWEKASAFETNGPAIFEIFAENAAASSLGSTPWTSVIASATSVYQDSMQNIPSTVGWIHFDFPLNFVYNGGNFQISADWDISGVSGSPSTGAFRWNYEPQTGLAIGAASSSASGVATLGSSSYSDERPNIRIIYEFTPLSDDLVLVSIDQPNDGCLSNAEVIEVTIANIGLNAATNFSVGYQITNPNGVLSTPVAEVYTDTLASAANATFTFATPANLGAPGTYVINAFISYPFDRDNSNNVVSDSVTNVKQIAPWSEDFETFGTGSASLPYPNGWTDGGGADPWWGEVGTTPSGTTTGPSVDHTLGTSSGTYLYTESSNSATGEEFLILSPCVDISALNCPKMSFWYHMFGAAMGELHVDVSTDGGATFTLDVIPPIVGQQQTSGSDPWIYVEANLGAFAGGDVTIRFRGIDANSSTSDIAIDDVSVFNGLGEDIAVNAITAPKTGCGSTAEAITIEIVNRGCSMVPAGAVVATFNSTGNPGSGPFSEPVNSAIAPGQILSYTFTNTVNVSNAGTYSFTAGVAFTPTSGFIDANLANNAVQDSFVNATQTVPWSETFESWNEGITDNYPGGWTDGGGDFTWESETGTTTSTNTGPEVDHTLGTSSGIYLYTEASSRTGVFNLLSPCIDLGTFTCPKLKFWYHMYGADIVSLSVDVSNDNGATWTNDLGLLVGQQQTSNSAPWDSLVVNLNGFTGQTIKIRFRGQTVSFDSDIAIDDIEVFDGTGEDVAVTEILSPVNGCGLGNEPVTVIVENLGCSNLSNVPVGYQIGLTGTPVVELIPGPIPSGGSVTYTFSALANLSATGSFTIGAATGLIGDINTSNDTSITIISNDFLPNNPTVQGDLVCYNTSANLFATSNGDTILWYDQLMGGNVIALGDAFQTPALTATDTFYAASGSFNAGNLVSTYNDNNGASGNMFDIQANAGPVRIDSFYIHTPSTTTADVEVFFKVGSYMGNTSDPSVWTSLGRDTIAANGNGVPTPISKFLDVTIPAGQVYAFNVFVHNGSIDYTNGTTEGAVFASDNFITFYEGIGTNTAFPTSFNTPRVWNGTVFYTALGCESDRVPVIADVHPTIQPIDLGEDTTICGNAFLALDAGNTGFNLNYSWSTGENTQQILATGTPGTADTTVYSVTVSDSLGCSAMADVTVIAEQPIDVIPMVTDVDCNGNGNGSINLMVAGGTGTYTYLWNTNDTTQSISGLNGGNYSVDVTDSNGCTAATTVASVDEPAAALGAMVDAITDVSCFGDSTGTVSVTISGGTQPYNFQWSNGDTTEDLTGLPAGSYTGVVTDANGCVLTTPALDITEPATAVAVAVDGVRDEDCAGDNSGYIFITPSGGTPPYTYLWSNGSTDPDLNAIPGGSYSGTVTDANGCSLTAGPVNIATMDSVPTADFSFVVSGGEATFTNNSSSNATSFAWDFGDGSPTQAGANPVYTYTANGNYSVTLIAYNNCGSDTTMIPLDMGTVSIDDIFNTNIQVYPNPTTGDFYIEFNRLFLKDVRIKLANLNGKTISYQELGNVNGALTHRVEVPANLARGMYLLQVISVDGTLARRIVLE